MKKALLILSVLFVSISSSYAFDGHVYLSTGENSCGPSEQTVSFPYGTVLSEARLGGFTGNLTEVSVLGGDLNYYKCDLGSQNVSKVWNNVSVNTVYIKVRNINPHIYGDKFCEIMFFWTY
nr:hypothetical protein [uncultured Draconibacterium sp.]